MVFLRHLVDVTCGVHPPRLEVAIGNPACWVFEYVVEELGVVGRVMSKSLVAGRSRIIDAQLASVNFVIINMIFKVFQTISMIRSHLLGLNFWSLSLWDAGVLDPIVDFQHHEFPVFVVLRLTTFTHYCLRRYQWISLPYYICHYDATLLPTIMP